MRTWQRATLAVRTVWGEERLERSPAERALGLLVDGKLNVSQPWALAGRRGNGIVGCLQHSIASRSRAGIAVLCSALFQHQLESCVHFWARHYQKAINLLEREHPKEGFKVLKGLEGRTDEERLRCLRLFSLQETEERPDGGLQLPHEGSGGPGAKLCSLGTLTKLEGMAWSCDRGGSAWR